MTFVKRIAGAAAVGATLLLGPITSSAQAGYVVTLAEVGSDVVATGSGPIDLTGLTMTMTVPLAGFIIPASGTILSGASFADIYSGFSGLTSFGSGGETVANN